MSTKGKATVVKQKATVVPGKAWWEAWWYDDRGHDWDWLDNYETEADALGANRDSSEPICIIKIEIPAMTIGEKK